MRVVAGLILLLIGLYAKAQTPMIAPLPGDSRPKVTASPTLEQPAMVPVAPAPVYVADPLFPAATETTRLTPEREPTRWRTDIVLGLPIALRVQRRFGDTAIWMEGGVSSYVDILGGFVGVRWDAHLYRGEQNLLTVRPGLDMYYSPESGCGCRFGHPYNGIYAGILDFDLNWQYQFSRRFHSSLGLKLGMGATAIGGYVYPLPVFGLTIGCQF